MPPALQDVTFSLGRGECLGVVGESGSGKSTLGRAVLQMIRYEGQVRLDGHDLAPLRGRRGGRSAGASRWCFRIRGNR